MPSPLPSKLLRDHTNIPFEIFIAAFSLLPIFILIYFYPTLPEQIPVFRNFRGDVNVWADKSVVSVFRVPLMAIDLQLMCLLMKYGSLRYQPGLPPGNVEGNLDFQRRLLDLSSGLWDWFRGLIAFKMSAESLDVLFMSDKRLHFLKTPAWAVAWIAGILGIAGALVYGYRMLIVKREMKKAFGNVSVKSQVDKANVYGGIFYYNPSDSAVFVDKYALNFGSLWSYALLACLAAYPLLVFSA